jgi:hypothetical protein
MPTGIAVANLSPIDPEEEARLWYFAFVAGFDFFSDLGFDSDQEMRLYVEAAWHRVGHLFLARFKGTIGEQAGHIPWALERFGPPRRNHDDPEHRPAAH